jgi:lauroyl/myristoyl acyltransferase
MSAKITRESLPADTGQHLDPARRRARLLNISDLAFVSYPILPLGFFFAIARVQGVGQYLTNKRLSEMVRENLVSLKPGLPDTELNRRTRRYFEYSRLRELLFLLAPKMSDETLSQLCPVDGLDHLDRCRASSQGVILLASHLNSRALFLLVMMLRRRRYDIRVAVPVEEDPWTPTAFRSLINRRSGIRPHLECIGAFYSQFNIRPIARALTEGAIIIQTGDGWHSAGFVEVDFLNRRLPFTTGMMRVAQLTGVPIVPIFASGTPPDLLKFVIEEPFHVERTEPVETKVAAYAKRLEYYVLEHPECWEHLEIPDLLQSWSNWSKRPLHERYLV